MKAPTAVELFGAEPWVTSPAPGGDGPNGPFLYNPIYFATPKTAGIVAQMLGGTVEPHNAILYSGPFQQNQPNQMVRMPILPADALDTTVPRDPAGRLINAGIIADLFAHNYDLDRINAMITEEVGFPFEFRMPGPQPEVKPARADSLMVALIGGMAMQADGTTWQRKS